MNKRAQDGQRDGATTKHKTHHPTTRLLIFLAWHRDRDASESLLPPTLSPPTSSPVEKTTAPLPQLDLPTDLIRTATGLLPNTLVRHLRALATGQSISRQRPHPAWTGSCGCAKGLAWGGKFVEGRGCC